MIPDTQVKPGVNTAHLGWIGNYLVDHFAHTDLVVIHLGDHADMPSLSSYDIGKKEMEGRRYQADIAAANEGFWALNAPLYKYNRRRVKNKQAQWWPERHLTLGNHENRITRAVESDAKLDGTLSLDDLDYAKYGWQVHDFLEVVDLDGVLYSHYFYRPMSGRPYAGENLETRLKDIGCSFTMGHQQTYKVAVRYVNGKQQRGLLAGSCYLHSEKYLGPQGDSYWRGILVCHEVEDGGYSLMEVSLDFLCRKYEHCRLEEFLCGS